VRATRKRDEEAGKGCAMQHNVEIYFPSSSEISAAFTISRISIARQSVDTLFLFLLSCLFFFLSFDRNKTSDGFGIFGISNRSSRRLSEMPVTTWSDVLM